MDHRITVMTSGGHEKGNHVHLFRKDPPLTQIALKSQPCLLFFLPNHGGLCKQLNFDNPVIVNQTIK